MAQPLNATLTYYGISPWEIEVFYGLLNSHFAVVQNETPQSDPDYVSRLELDIPLDFSEAFFQWFDFRRWEKIKAILKEMKRRRGSGNALMALIRFSGRMQITFVISSIEKRWFDNAIEKIDFVLELLPHHTEKLPPRIASIIYGFDTESARWRLGEATDADGRRFVFRGDAWVDADPQ